MTQVVDEYFRNGELAEASFAVLAGAVSDAAVAPSESERKGALDRAEAANQAAAAECRSATAAIPWTLMNASTERMVASDAATLLRDPRFLLGVAHTDASAVGEDLEQQKLVGLKRAQLLDRDAHFAVCATFFSRLPLALDVPRALTLAPPLVLPRV